MYPGIQVIDMAKDIGLMAMHCAMSFKSSANRHLFCYDGDKVMSRSSLARPEDGVFAALTGHSQIQQMTHMRGGLEVVCCIAGMHEPPSASLLSLMAELLVGPAAPQDPKMLHHA